MAVLLPEPPEPIEFGWEENLCYFPEPKGYTILWIDQEPDIDGVDLWAYCTDGKIRSVRLSECCSNPKVYETDPTWTNKDGEHRPHQMWPSHRRSVANILMRRIAKEADPRKRAIMLCTLAAMEQSQKREHEI